LILGGLFAFPKAENASPCACIGKCATNADARQFFTGTDGCRYGSILLLLIDLPYDCQ
jgi:hypothetical protein